MKMNWTINSVLLLKGDKYGVICNKFDNWKYFLQSRDLTHEDLLGELLNNDVTSEHYPINAIDIQMKPRKV